MSAEFSAAAMAGKIAVDLGTDVGSLQRNGQHVQRKTCYKATDKNAVP